MGKATRRTGRGATVDMLVVPQPRRWAGFQILGMLLRWRAELTALAVVLVLFFWLDSFGNPVVTACVLVGVPVLALAVPFTRRLIVSRVWCVVDRHRIRSCLKQTKIRTMTRDGDYPFMLWARPTKTGERVWLWLPAGSAARDIEDALDYVAPACMARDARLHTLRKLTTLCAVDVIRRDPLSTKKVVDSPLSKFTTGRPTDADLSNVTPIKPTPATSTVDTTADGAATTTTTNTKTTNAKTTNAKTTAEPAKQNAGVVVNGEDLSDYVD